MRYEVRTKLTPEETLERAIAHFGPQGTGLKVINQHTMGLVFEGGGGHVAVTACPAKKAGEKTRVELETREWDYAVQQFIGKVP